VREAAEVQEVYSLPRLLQAEVSVGQPAAEAYEAHCEVTEAGGPCGPCGAAATRARRVEAVARVVNMMVFVLVGVEVMLSCCG